MEREFHHHSGDQQLEWRQLLISTVVMTRNGDCITGEVSELILGINIVGVMRLNHDYLPVMAEIEALIIPSLDS